MTDTSSEEYRHQCEVRLVLRWRLHGAWKAHQYIEDVAKQRGKEAGDRLMRDCQNQWSLGNRGEEGQWLDSALRNTHQ